MRRAILAGAGLLPELLLETGPDLVVRFAGDTRDTGAVAVLDARIEQLGALFTALKARGITELCLAGAMGRPALDPAAFDAVTMALLPRLGAAFQQGDDSLAREVIAMLEEQGFTLRAAHELRPDLVATGADLAGTPGKAQLADAARARAVLAALGPLDVGQGAVAARGQLLGIETLQGTDAMLDFVAETRPGSGGVLVKRPKPGQDLRVDMPAIGPATVAAAAAAGLSGIEIAEGGVLLLDRAATLETAAAAGLALWAAP